MEMIDDGSGVRPWVNRLDHTSHLFLCLILFLCYSLSLSLPATYTNGCDTHSAYPNIFITFPPAPFIFMVVVKGAQKKKVQWRERGKKRKKSQTEPERLFKVPVKIGNETLQDEFGVYSIFKRTGTRIQIRRSVLPD